jgi:Flp pilus assembly protein TadG
MIRKSQFSANPMMRALRSFGDTSGSVATEFALILPVTALLLSGIIEFGVAVNSGTALENGARAGAQFAIEQGLNAPGIKAVVANASNLDPDTLTVTSREFWECSDNWGTEVDASTNCGTNVPLANFIEVKVTQTYTPIFSFLGSLTPTKLDGSATVRVAG